MIRPGALLASMPLQAALALACTLPALPAMVVAPSPRLGPRSMLGAVLLICLALYPVARKRMEGL